MIGMQATRGTETNRKAQRTYLGMGTLISHTVYGRSAEEAVAAAYRETVRLENLFSRFIAGSDIDRLNRAAGRGGVALHPDTFAVLSLAREYARLTDGYFDVTVCPLVRLWSGSDAGEAPSGAEIAAALKLVGCRELRLPRFGRTAQLMKAGQCVDLGGIGKGYAADRVIAMLRRFGVRSACTDFGGNIATLGARPDGSPWRIGIRHPRDAGRLIGAVRVADRTVVTSGDDQRSYRTADGRLYHHILDPHTGEPVENDVLSVTIVADGSAAADALATAVCAAGRDKGAAYLQSVPRAQAVIVDRNLSVHVTAGLRQCFQPAAGIQTYVL